MDCACSRSHSLPLTQPKPCSPLLLNIAYIANFGVLLALMHYRHQTPTNFQLLALFTVLESYLVATIGSFKRGQHQSFLRPYRCTVDLTCPRSRLVPTLCPVSLQPSCLIPCLLSSYVFNCRRVLPDLAI